ncbi:MAG: toxin [Oscillatoriales cyanobacterium CG2_30_44_21]|nr:MAG: toxin [Oscillatoriales cyanobacterium CG2_30_44_21]
MRNFEYDNNKSQSNSAKHGIDFVEAQELWNDCDLLEIPSKIEGEIRFVVIGKINSKHWSGVITYRDQNIRIISVRRSRIPEVALYERQGI